MTPLSRRRFLIMSAACAATPAVATPTQAAHWRGVALGAKASLRLEGLTDAQAAPVFAAVEAELNRLENIFSLYRPESQLSQLNRTGYLNAPAPELLNVLTLCSALFEASGGVFDPTIQPVWVALAQGADQQSLQAAWNTVGWDRITLDSGAIRLADPGQSALTLNGIAQGAITDRIAALLTAHGLRDVLVDMGEIAARGQRNDGRNWQVGLAGPAGAVQKSITLQDHAVATSDANSIQLADTRGHILNPKEDRQPGRIVSVSAPSAAIADGLSTALCILPEAQSQTLVSAFPGAVIEMFL